MMVEPVTTAIAIVDKLLKGFKRLREVNQKIDNAELQNLIADLMMDMTDLKLQMVESIDENIRLRSRIDELTKSVDLRSKLRREKNYYILTEKVPGYDEGPFCLTCMDEDEKLISMHTYNTENGVSRSCIRCKGMKRYG